MNLGNGNDYNGRLFQEIRLLSSEIHSLLRQGVREGVNERIQYRDGVLREWFASVKSSIDLTMQQQDYLENLLETEKALLAEIKQEQSEIAGKQRGQKQTASYQNISRH